MIRFYRVSSFMFENKQNQYTHSPYNILTTRLIFNSGSIDPWHALSVLSNLSSSETAIYINGTSHCANMEPAEPDDPPQLVQARKVLPMIF